MTSIQTNAINKYKHFAALWNENSVAVIIIILSFLIYLTTMSRSVGVTDSGELAAVACTLGIAHPTGYPLFTLLGRLWILISYGAEEIVRLNIFALLLTSLAVGLFFKTTLAINKSDLLFRFKSRKKEFLTDKHIIFASAITSLILGFSTTFWLQSTNVEVYSLHLVLILFSIWFFINGMEEQSKGNEYISNKLLLFAFIFGLSFSNHMTTILLAPAFAWVFFRSFGFSKATFKLVAKLIPFFLLGISVYLYLPIRSANNPLFDWGHPATLDRFWWHVSGKQFSVWLFSGWSIVKKQLSYYLTNFSSEFSILIFLFILIGIISLWKQSKQLLIFFLILFSTTILYSINYDIFDIDSYFLLSYLTVCWLIFYGINSVINWSIKNGKWIKIAIVILICTLPLIQIIQNYGKCDESKSRLPEEFVKKVFSDLKPNAVVIASQWDYFISPSWYYQYVQNIRKDVLIIDKSLLQNRSWYFHQLEGKAKWLMDRIRPSTAQFLVELDKFERNKPFDYNIIFFYWQNLLKEIVEKSLIDRPVYVDIRLNQEFSQEYKRTPAGLFLEFTKEEDVNNYRSAIWKIPHLKPKNKVIEDFEKYYVSVLLLEANWLILHNRKQEAMRALVEVLRIEPSNLSAIWILEKLKKG